LWPTGQFFCNAANYVRQDRLVVHGCSAMQCVI
jgi:hypothetical protein